LAHEKQAAIRAARKEKPVRVLVACEESQAVCKSFRERGHEAYSCDIQPCSGGHPEWHIQGDVLPLLKGKWNMVIAFPPCTDLAVSGAAHFAKKRADGSQQRSIDFFMEFTKLSCFWAIENPIGIMSNIYRKPNQIIHPYHFGHECMKATCLWLNGLPQLVHTCIVGKGEMIKYADGTTRSKWFNQYGGKSLKTKIARSKTFPGIADAMSAQWGTERAASMPQEAGPKK